MTCHWLHFEQGTPEWKQARCGLLTASHSTDMSSILKSGAESAKRKNLKKQLVAERFTGIPTHVKVNYDMQWGTDNEPLARGTYSEFTGNRVEIVGLAISKEIELLGASPDGMIGDEGVLEIKCPTSQTFVDWVVEGVVPDQHKPQMLIQLAVTGRKWCDFVAFDPRFPAEQDLFIRRFTPHAREIEAMKKAAREFLAEVAAMERAFLKARMV